MLQETITIETIREYIPDLKPNLTKQQISDLKWILIGSAHRINWVLEFRQITPLELFASMGGAASKVLETIPAKKYR